MTLTLTMCRYGSEFTEEYEDIHEAISSAWGAVETNEAAPVKLEHSEGLIGEFYDLSGVYEDPRYNRGLTQDDVIKLIHTIKAEDAQRRLDYEREKKAAEQRLHDRMRDLVERNARIEYQYAYSGDDLRTNRVLPGAQAVDVQVTFTKDGPPVVPVQFGKKQDVCVGGAVHQDLHLVRDPAMAPSQLAPGHKHFLVETTSGDFVPLDMLTEVED